jgi:hypothetical protein
LGLQAVRGQAPEHGGNGAIAARNEVVAKAADNYVVSNLNRQLHCYPPIP